MWTYKGDVNSALVENWKEPSSSIISLEASFNGGSNEDTLNVKKTCWQFKKIIGMQNIFKYQLPQQKVLRKILVTDSIDLHYL